MKVYLEKLNLHSYRNFKELELVFDSDVIIILGENGSGKTNILEAISLLSPGRGLRSAKYEEISHKNIDDWSCCVYMQSKLGKALIQSNYFINNNVRTIEYNGSKIRNSELNSLANIIWLTPQMDGIFLSSASDRRRFLDRIVYNFYQEHASNINKYDHLVSQRLTLLTQASSVDETWLTTLEKKIADIALKINTLRSKVIIFLQEAIETVNSPFPKANLSINYLFEREIGEGGFLELYFRNLNNNRLKDKITKRTNFGINKQELIIHHKDKNQLAKFCSTGEQKALLTSILMGQIEANKRVAKTTTPILILDELFVHLDNNRKDSLAEYIINSKLQTFITATDMAGLDMIAKYAQIIYL